jgi:hypothetical protein
MHSRFRAKSITLTAIAALLALLVVPGMLLATPKPGAPGRGFRLMARATGAITINRIYCGLAATGEVCVDSLNSSTIGGGYWPKGSPQQYVFNSGLQAAGSVQAGIPGFSWSGDTTGAFFFDPKGTTQHGELVQPIWNSLDPSDLAAWPQAARVPEGDAVADIFFPQLQGEKSASEGDVWTIAWDGNPGFNAGRKHPLGIAVETRGMGWNSPTFNDDIVYFIYTFYNVTSADPNDYLNIRPGMREIMQELGVRFQALNNAAFGTTIPFGGYTVENFYANFAADMDVSTDAGENYSSVNLPFAMGYTYHDFFRATDNNYRLPADIGNAPFLNAYGFVGVKYLRSPIVAGQEVGIRLFSNSVNGGVFGDPQNAQQLFRYLSGNIQPALGDGQCNRGDQLVTRICYVKDDTHADMRFFQSSGPMNLAPGEFGSIVVGYIFSSAVAVGGCNTTPCAASIKPGEPRRLVSVDSLAIGANTIDSMTGFAGYADLNNDSVVQQSEFTVVRGSLLSKALVAQTVFNNRFLLPQAPAAPDFFLVPGDNKVTVIWRPSASEITGDIYFNVASAPQVLQDPDGAGPLPPVLVNNQLYDPNYRRFDVEGYRVYRGRVDNPSQLTLLAQYDYTGTVMTDYLGALNPTPDCAPELGLETGCPVNYDTPPPGTAYNVSHDNDLVGSFTQVKLGDRTMLANGDAILLKSDTALTGGAAVAAGKAGPALSDNGVPFVYVDETSRNNLRYFYSVSAFDINSVQSGASVLESARLTKSTTPVHAASNYVQTTAFSVRVRGRGVENDPAAPLPTLDEVTGVFSGRMPAANGAELGLVGDFVSQVVSGNGSFFARLDSLRLGQINMTVCCGGGGPGVPIQYWYTVGNGAGPDVQLHFQIEQDLAVTHDAQGLFNGIQVHSTYGAKYGGSTAFNLLAAITPSVPAVGFTGGAGQAMILAEPGFTAATIPAGATGVRYDGARWYSGTTETMANPTSGNCVTAQGPFAACGAAGQPQPAITNFNNAGEVNGAGLVYMPRAGLMINREWRNMEAIMSGAWRAADFRVYWGAPGVVDSVIDLTHNVVVPFDSAGGTDPNEEMGAGWGILTTAATSAAGSYDGRPTHHTFMDWTCVEPFKTRIAGAIGFFPCAPGTEYTVQRVATLGQVAVGAGHNQATTGTISVRSAANTNGGDGFSMYIAGTLTFFGQMTQLPSNTFWTLRTYSGAVYGGGGAGCTNCNGGNNGLYRFGSAPRPMTAVGAEVLFNWSASHSLANVDENALDQVHTVPDPYYITNQFESSPSGKIIKFVNLPNQAVVRVYSTSGVLVRVLEHNSSQFSGSLDWDVRNRNNQVVASGVYFYHIESPSGARRVGRMTIVNFAQ